MKKKFVSLYHPDLLNSFERNEHRALALYIKGKKAYKNSCVYNWNYSSLSQRMGLSIYIVKKYIPILMAKGFVYEHNENLIFKSLKKLTDYNSTKLSKRYWYKLDIKFKDSLGTILNEIYLVHIKQNIAHQKYHIRNKTDYLKAQSPNGKIAKKRYKKIKQYVRDNGEPGKVSTETILGMRKISELCNISLGKSKQLLDALEFDRKIKRKVLKVELKDKVNAFGLDSIREAYKNNAGYLYIANGTLICIIGTSISIL